MMKKMIVTVVLTVMSWMTALQAQQIAVVSSTGSTTICQTLTQAIENASSGSVIYLPGGSFQIHDSVTVTKPVTIVGIGHKVDGENADGNTNIVGNLYFGEGSDGSAVMGCYITNQIIIGRSGPVNNVLVKLCNVFSIDIDYRSVGTIITQNYVRDDIFGGNNSTNEDYRAEATIKNNVVVGHEWLVGAIKQINGIIQNNIFGGCRVYGAIRTSDNSVAANNIFLSNCGYIPSQSFGNMALNQDVGEGCINIQAESWDEVFKNYNEGKISPVTDFHFKDEYAQYEGKVGIYAGDGFDDAALPPVPYIVAKSIPSQTDASGKLTIKVRVNAGN